MQPALSSPAQKLPGTSLVDMPGAPCRSSVSYAVTDRSVSKETITGIELRRIIKPPPITSISAEELTAIGSPRFLAKRGCLQIGTKYTP